MAEVCFGSVSDISGHKLLVSAHGGKLFYRAGQSKILVVTRPLTPSLVISQRPNLVTVVATPRLGVLE